MVQEQLSTFTMYLLSSHICADSTAVKSMFDLVQLFHMQVNIIQNVLQFCLHLLYQGWTVLNAPSSCCGNLAAMVLCC